MAIQAIAQQRKRGPLAPPSAVRSRTSPAAAGHDLTATIRHLQRTVGNKATSMLVRSSLRQPTLVVGPADDCYEREADRVADHVMRMAEPASAFYATPAHSIQRKCACSAGDDDKCECAHNVEVLQRAAVDSARIASDPGCVDDVLRSPGRPLDTSTRRFMESRFERDFASVRIHTDHAAAASARAVNAHAYTVDQDIVFAEGRFGPDTSAGRRLLAHELVHTIQQSPRGHARASALQRAPAPPQEQPTTFSLVVVGVSPGPALFFAQPFYAEPIDLSKPATLTGTRFVNGSNIVEWAVRRIWDEVTLHGGSAVKDRLVKLLRRGELNGLHAVWRPHATEAVVLISPLGLATVSGDAGPKIQTSYPRDNPFSGDDDARVYWAKYLLTNWSKVEEKLDDNTTDLYVEMIRSALRTRLIPPGATLVKQPARVKQIEDAPSMEEFPLGRWGATAKVGLTWEGKRAKSATQYDLAFELIGHEGVYFEMSMTAFLRTDPFIGKVATDVAQNTKGIAIVGQFIKGFLNALASPVVIVLDTTAKVLDMATMGASALGKWRGWYDIGYTCLSSTCRNYEACLANKKSATCQDEVLQQALEEATILIPIYRQGVECLDGDAEACGGIAALALGLVEGGVRKASKGSLAEAEAAGGKGRAPMSQGEFEAGLIREAIERPRADEPSFAKPFEEPAAREKSFEPRVEIKKPAEPTARPAADMAAETVVDAKAAQAGSEVKLGDGKHGVAATTAGKKSGFHLCSSHCSLVADKLAQIEKILPEESEMRRDIGFLEHKVRGLDQEVKAGRLTEDMANRAARDIARGLGESAGAPVIDTLLQMSVEDLQANRASLRRQVRSAFELGNEVSREFAEAGRKGSRTELPEGTQASGTTTRPRTAVLTDAEVLAAELTRDVGPRPPGYEAHHIIPKGMKQAAEARKILQDAGIGINEGANGIWLPKDTGVPNPLAAEIHSKVHTSRAIRIMTEQLREGAKEGPAGVRRALRQIQLTLSDLRYER